MLFCQQMGQSVVEYGGQSSLLHTMCTTHYVYYTLCVLGTMCTTHYVCVLHTMCNRNILLSPTVIRWQYKSNTESYVNIFWSLLYINTMQYTHVPKVVVHTVRYILYIHTNIYMYIHTCVHLLILQCKDVTETYVHMYIHRHVMYHILTRVPTGLL